MADLTSSLMLSGASAGTSTLLGVDSSLLLNAMNARAGVGAASAASLLGPGKKAPTPPWSPASQAPKIDELTKAVLMGRKFVDEGAAKLDVKGASEDYRKLFAMHQGLATLEALARRADAKDVTAAELRRIQEAFGRGTAELSEYIDDVDFEQIRLTRGDATDRARAQSGVPQTKARYVTAPLHSGTANEPVQAFQGDVKFDLTVKRLNNTSATVSFDLSEMGSTPRTMNNVVSYMNAKLQAGGFYSRMAVERFPGEAKEIMVGGKPVKVANPVDRFALKIQGDTTEKLTFSAPTTAPAIYLAQTAGNPDPDKKPSTDDGVQVRQFLKLEGGADLTTEPRPGDVNWVQGRVFSKDLPKEVEAVRKTVAGPDGSVYMLADVNGAVSGQSIKGERDVALMKYDSAGNLVYTRTLGAADQASGFGLAVSADGKVAVTGSVTGALDQGDDGVDGAKTDSFVTVFDAAGQEVWAQRQGARDEDQGLDVAWGADGQLFVLGKTKGSISGNPTSGGWDTYLRAFDPKGKLLSTRQFGTAGDDKPAGLVVQGSAVIVASNEGGAAKLRRFDYSAPGSPTLAATRDLGSLQGGALVGVGLIGGDIVLAGSGAGLSLGTVTRPSSGGLEAFAARISADLGTGSDAIAYYGGSGEDAATAMTIAGGKVWLTGTSKGELPGLTAKGKLDGFVAELDIASGTVGFSQRFTAKDDMAAPSSIAVDAAGASILDRLGLPNGAIQYKDSQRIIDATSVRAGDQFQIRTRENGRPTTITIAADETLETLASKIRRAGGFGIKVDIVNDGTTRRLQIQPRREQSTVEILGGAEGRDALEALGLSEGYVRKLETEDGVSAPADGGDPIYGLRLARDLSISSKGQIKTTLDELSYAMSTVRKAFREMEERMAPKDPLKDVKGEVPAYLKNQIANYQAALSRLTGG